MISYLVLIRGQNLNSFINTLGLPLVLFKLLPSTMVKESAGINPGFVTVCVEYVSSRIDENRYPVNYF
jgi:hypothetical protein